MKRLAILFIFLCVLIGTSWSGTIIQTNDVVFSNSVRKLTLPTTSGQLVNEGDSSNIVANYLSTWVPPSWNVATNIYATGGTLTILKEYGPYMAYEVTSSPTIITIDLSTFPTNGTTTFSLDLYYGVNTISFTNTTIDTGSVARLSMTNNAWNSLIFHKGYMQTNFQVR